MAAACPAADLFRNYIGYPQAVAAGFSLRPQRYPHERPSLKTPQRAIRKQLPNPAGAFKKTRPKPGQCELCPEQPRRCGADQGKEI